MKVMGSHPMRCDSSQKLTFDVSLASPLLKSATIGEVITRIWYKCLKCRRTPGRQNTRTHGSFVRPGRRPRGTCGGRCRSRRTPPGRSSRPPGRGRPGPSGHTARIVILTPPSVSHLRDTISHSLPLGPCPPSHRAEVLPFQFVPYLADPRAADVGAGPLQVGNAERLGQPFHGLLDHLGLGPSGGREQADALLKLAVGREQETQEVIPPRRQAVDVSRRLPPGGPRFAGLYDARRGSVRKLRGSGGGC